MQRPCDDRATLATSLDLVNSADVNTGGAASVQPREKSMQEVMLTAALVRARGDADCCVGAGERSWLTGVGDGAVLLRPWKHGVAAVLEAEWCCCCVGGGAAVLEAVLLCWSGAAVLERCCCVGVVLLCWRRCCCVGGGAALLEWCCYVGVVLLFRGGAAVLEAVLLCWRRCCCVGGGAAVLERCCCVG
ncbi:unnamed protein product [Closterium sp. NIES-53]